MWRIIQLTIAICFLAACEGQNGKQENSSNRTESNALIDKLDNEKENYLNALNVSTDSAKIAREKLLKSLAELSDPNKKYAVKIYTGIAYEESRRHHTTIADSIFTLANSLAKNLKDSAQFCHIYLCKGNLFRQISSLDSSIYYYKKTISLSEKHRDTTSLVSGLNNLATSLNIKSQDKNAPKLLKKALSLCKNDLSKKADIYNNLGIFSAQKSQLTTALEYYQQALDLHEQVGLELKMVSTLNNMANIYIDLGNDSLALQNYNKIYKIGKDNNNKRYETLALLNLGFLFFEINDLEQSKKHSYKALELIKDDPYSYYQAILYLNLGILENANKNFKKAKAYFLNSLSIAKKLQLSQAFDESKLNLARLYLNEQNYSKAESYAIQVFNSSIKKENIDFTYKSAFLLGDVYAGLKEYNKAVKYYSLHEEYQTQYQESIDKKQNRKFGYKYELQKKEAINQQLILNQQLQNQQLATKEYQIKHQKTTILLGIIIVLSLILVAILLYYKNQTRIKNNAILRVKNKEINKNNQLLQNENKFKNRLISIVSHDIKNPIIGLHNFLLLLNAGELTKKEQEEIIGEVTAKTEATLNMVENLLQWTKQQLTNKPVEFKTINFYELTQEALTLFNSTAKEKGVEIHPTCPKDFLIYSDPNILKLLIRNLISNSLKFTQKGGNIEIGIIKTEKDFTISIKDTGRGIRESDQSSIFNDDLIHTTKGSNQESGNGIGLKLCKYFIEKSNGHIWFNSRENAGTTFYVKLPSHDTTNVAAKTVAEAVEI